MPRKLFRAFLDFNRAFPGSELVKFLHNGGKKHERATRNIHASAVDNIKSIE